MSFDLRLGHDACTTRRSFRLCISSSLMMLFQVFRGPATCPGHGWVTKSAPMWHTITPGAPSTSPPPPTTPSSPTATNSIASTTPSAVWRTTTAARRATTSHAGGASCDRRPLGGFSHDEIYARVQQGPGRVASADAEAAWATVESTIRAVDEQLTRAVRQIGVSWEGAAADRVQGGMTAMSTWALDAAGDALLTRNGIAAQADEAACVRTAHAAAAHRGVEPHGARAGRRRSCSGRSRISALSKTGWPTTARVAVELMNQYSIRSVGQPAADELLDRAAHRRRRGGGAGLRAAGSGRDRDGCEPRRDPGRDGGAGCRCQRDGIGLGRGRRASGRRSRAAQAGCATWASRPGPTTRPSPVPTPGAGAAVPSRPRTGAVPRGSTTGPGPAGRSVVPVPPTRPCPPAPQTRSPAVHRARPGRARSRARPRRRATARQGSRVRRQRASPRAAWPADPGSHAPSGRGPDPGGLRLPPPRGRRPTGRPSTPPSGLSPRRHRRLRGRPLVPPSRDRR